MRELAYQLVDVFTDVRFGGNQLAVFTDAGGLDLRTMQTIARELNLSESVFVLPPESPDNHVCLRIFTPAMELPFAGHPTVGTGYVLYRMGKIPAEARFEKRVGVIPVSVAPCGEDDFLVTMQQPVSKFGAVYENRALIAEILSLSPDDLIDSLPVQAVSSGVYFLFIPVKSLDAMRRIKIRLDLWEKHLKQSEAPHIFAFSPEVEHPTSTVHSRMFAPLMGIPEDPATGGASGPLGAYLVQHGVVKPGTPIVSEQGLEMGRASFIHINIEGTPDNITAISIGGTSRPVGHGVIFVD